MTAPDHFASGFGHKHERVARVTMELPIPVTWTESPTKGTSNQVAHSLASGIGFIVDRPVRVTHITSAAVKKKGSRRRKARRILRPVAVLDSGVIRTRPLATARLGLSEPTMTPTSASTLALITIEGKRLCVEADVSSLIGGLNLSRCHARGVR